MARYRYLIVGGGMAGDAAARGIRDHDQDGTIGLVAAERDPPYSRPPLSKGLWAGGDEAKIWRDTANLGVDVHLGRRVTSIDLSARTALDDAGTTHSFERLLLATGGEARRLPGAPPAVVAFRTLEDYRRLRAAAVPGAKIAVVGGGFIGSEIAAALATARCRVTMLFPEDGIGARLFPSALSAFVNDVYRERGVEVRPNELVTAIETSGDGFRVVSEDGVAIEADAVVTGLGITPATELAEALGLPVDDGIVVDAYGRVGGRDDVFAAGDVARFPVAALGRTMRVEHEDHANTHGRVVGANMAGAGIAYDHLPFFYSDLFDLGYEAVGELDARLATLEEWVEPYRKGVVAYVDADGRPRGFLLWDVWGKVDPARALIQAGEPLAVESLRALLD
ncbi:MAG: pyridine nucleotide-disulfide oxidoreductase [Gaiellaceae bacterium]|nr:MAG: pyridine nucleotide-disulfide oxidoreductase [Gaiellaceae bacterium]